MNEQTTKPREKKINSWSSFQYNIDHNKGHVKPIYLFYYPIKYYITLFHSTYKFIVSVPLINVRFDYGKTTGVIKLK